VSEPQSNFALKSSPPWYRAIYEIKQDTAKFMSVEELSKHEY